MNANKNILFLSYDGLTDPLGESQILPYLSGLSRCGYHITIISFEKPERYAKEKKRINDFCDENLLHWSPLVYHKRPPVISTLYDLWMLRRTCQALHKKLHFNIVHCRSYVTSLAGLWMKHRYNLKFIFDMRGFWADERVEGGLWNLRNPGYRVIYNFFKRKEKQFLKEADYIISLTQNAKHEIESWPINIGPISVIPTCVDLVHFDPKKIDVYDKNMLKGELGIRQGDFVVLYLGSLGTWYLVKEMLDFFSEVKSIKKEACFLVVTPDQLDISGYQYKKDVIVRSSSREKIPLYISLANVSVFFIKTSFSKKASSATKMGEVLAMGIPVITNKGWGDVDRFETLLPGFFSVNLNEYSGVIKRSFENETEVIRKGALENFSLSSGITSYNSVYQCLM